MVIVQLANYTPSTPHLLNRSELRFAPIFAFLTAQNCHLNAQRSLLFKILEFCACNDYHACAQRVVAFSGAAVQF